MQSSRKKIYRGLPSSNFPSFFPSVSLQLVGFCYLPSPILQFSMHEDRTRMPRPGPKPYECVRRAWHSDRHQPIRGSLIRELFRLANDRHNLATRKNKEWQEKLPIVVLKAEEVMYSKANSEAEYKDLITLWERANDAIDTIIRRDETTEHGNFLQPCIEAALSLGCAPRKASRSQRHSSRCYISPSTQQSTVVRASALKQPGNSNHQVSPPHASDLVSSPKRSLYYPPQLTYSNGKATLLETYPFPVPVTQHPLQVGIAGDKNVCPQVTFPLAKPDSIYLSHSDVIPRRKQQGRNQAEPSENRNVVYLDSCPSLIGTSEVSQKMVYERYPDVLRNTPSRRSVALADAEFDLSLRLGPASSAFPSPCNSWDDELEDLGSTNSQEDDDNKSSLCNQMMLNQHVVSSIQSREKFYLFLGSAADEEATGSPSLMEGANGGLVLGKRKRPCNEFFYTDGLCSRPTVCAGMHPLENGK